ncbi:hypothetical protein TcasGA2_TC003650 [Tribolium castaneum]|uniref:LRAT domain-containing protein n=1 Tax=Tribolium castaneum TaxID=7070 RepID=D6WDF6_TRICA|nr:PREDICTED: uncharacterized protein LOC107397545 [Tribolium castaneum]XP_015833606.1 PREDICTED: uncharacterized protein LOC107397545 [Tribolium castaneum]EFA00764.1 hypothetical protein TcasGA2_TC003650 [Tribolium castaneum]|eukprot:XP_015833605.1 PREDICTED: uncharacterized protein LOC107397545 [Tribolium castaneum]
MIRVFLWEARDYYNFGHISMSLSDGTYISFWPEEEVVLIEKKKSQEALPHIYAEDVEVEGRPSDQVLTLPDDIVNAEKIKSWWNSYKYANQWNLFGNNCAFVIREAFLVGGIFLTDEARAKSKKGCMYTPRKVFDWIKVCKKVYEKHK